MQINTNSYTQGFRPAYQAQQTPQDSQDSFSMLVSLQDNKTTGDKEAIKDMGESTEKENLSKILGALMLNGDNSADLAYVSVRQAATLEAIRLYGDFKSGDSQADIAHNQQLGDKAHEIWLQWMSKTDQSEITKILNSSFNALKNMQNNVIRLDEFGNLSQLPQHIFKVEKSEAIDILSEILQGIKA